jgi:hypothetical protein
MNQYIYNINGIKIQMYINKPYSKLKPYLSKEKEFDLEFHVGRLLEKTNPNFLSTKYYHKISNWQIQLQNFDGDHTIVYFKGDRFFSRQLFYTMVFEALLQYKYSKKNKVTLHASAISTNTKSYAFSGDATVGKTSLLLYFLSKGYHYMADDQTVIDAQTLRTLPYILPIGIDLSLALKTKLTLTFKHKILLLLATFVNNLFLHYTALTPMIQTKELIFNNKKILLGKPTKIHKIFVLENSNTSSITKLTSNEAYEKLWKCKFGSKGRLPALIYYGEEYKKMDKNFVLWKQYRELLFQLTKTVPVYKISFQQHQLEQALKLIEQEINKNNSI